MTDLVVDLGSLPDDVREKLAELDLELSEGNCTHHQQPIYRYRKPFESWPHACKKPFLFLFDFSLSLPLVANILCHCFGMIVVMRAPKTILLRAVRAVYGNFENYCLCMNKQWKFNGIDIIPCGWKFQFIPILVTQANTNIHTNTHIYAHIIQVINFNANSNYRKYCSSPEWKTFHKMKHRQLAKS